MSVAGVTTAHGCMLRTSDKLQSIKVHVTCETADVQHELEKSRLARKREMKMKQYDQYRRTFYGTPTEKERMRKEHRQALLGQVHQKEADIKSSVVSKAEESQMAVAMDRACLDEDSQTVANRANYLKQFRDQNKTLMEMRASNTRQTREEENRRERELLKYDPINWSKTLV